MGLRSAIFRLVISCLMVTAAPALARPSLFLVGDSTVRTTREDKCGWGDALTPWLAPHPPKVENRARGGASTRSFRDDGSWATTLEAVRPGDLVLIQFGHNDQGSPRDGKATLPGVGHETARKKNRQGKSVTVHTFGWYLDVYVREVREKGAIPIIVTPVPRNVWDGEKTASGRQPHAGWARQVAERTGTPLLDLHRLVADHYAQMGRAHVSKHYFRRGDESHTTREGAAVTARLAANALKSHPDEAIRRACGGK